MEILGLGGSAIAVISLRFCGQFLERFEGVRAA